MVELIRDEGYDIVCASRYMKGGQQIGGPLAQGPDVADRGGKPLLAGGVADARRHERLPRLPPERLAEFPIESQGGFAYSLEITAKAYAAGRRITEVPSTWRDRSAGQSRFRLRAWLPHYLRWYFYALTHRPRRDRTTSTRIR